MVGKQNDSVYGCWIDTPLGNVPVRREIRDLQNNYPDQWSLYLQGLEALHWSDQNDPLSLYGIASEFNDARLPADTKQLSVGIHGRPYRTWGDAPGLAHKIGTSGYCPHSNMLFLGWHRPYLALFEVCRGQTCSRTQR